MDGNECIVAKPGTGLVKLRRDRTATGHSSERSRLEDTSPASFSLLTTFGSKSPTLCLFPPFSFSIVRLPDLHRHTAFPALVIWTPKDSFRCSKGVSQVRHILEPL
jgi:hypothetical protein